MRIDSQKLNKVIVKNKNPLQRIDNLVDKLQRESYFSMIDLRTGYHQLRVKKHDIVKKTFQTLYDHYMFLVRSFDLINALATFMDMMNRVFR